MISGYAETMYHSYHHCYFSKCHTHLLSFHCFPKIFRFDTKTLCERRTHVKHAILIFSIFYHFFSHYIYASIYIEIFLSLFFSFLTTCTIDFPKLVCTNNISIKKNLQAKYGIDNIKYENGHLKSRRLGLKNLSTSLERNTQLCIFIIFFFESREMRGPCTWRAKRKKCICIKKIVFFLNISLSSHFYFSSHFFRFPSDCCVQTGN